MPSLTSFIQEIVSDPNFGSNDSEYLYRLEGRIKELNHAQLQGMYNHLKKCSESADSKV